MPTKRSIKKFFTPKNLLRFSFKVLIAGLILIAILFIWFSKDLPRKGKIINRKSSESTVIMDRNGNSLYNVFGNERRTSIDFAEIPQDIKDATVALEDKNFYHHFGFDYRGFSRAVIYRILGKPSAGGGSTITQQFVKNALLSPKQNISRKIKELILSIELEQIYSKEEILAFYLNEIPYGNNNYGIEAASNYYFNKRAKDLTLPQAAILASIPQRPTYYSPYGTHTDQLINRRNSTLKKMLDQGYITQEEYDSATKDDTLAQIQPKHEAILAPHFVMYVKEQLETEYGQDIVENGGLRVYTTLDIEKQKYAEQAIQDNTAKIQKYNGDNASLVSIDTKTGEILAMVGSIDYFNRENNGNYNATIALRQPGSSFKPIAYATAFKGKYNPAYTLFDLPTDFGNYSPQNFNGSFNGPVSMRTALQNSLNIPAVKTLYLAGIDKTIDTAHDIGITSLNDRARYGLSLVLGGGEVKLVDLTNAYATFGNQGKNSPLSSILKIEDKDGKIIKENKSDKQKEVLDPQVAYEISDVLSDNNARGMVFGTNSPLHFPERTVAAKTGTTQNFMDAWTVGYTPSIAAGVWVGRNDNKPMNNMADGVVIAAPIFHQYMDLALKDKENEEFARPAGIEEITVEKYSNKLPTDASKEFVKDIFTKWQIPKDHDDVNVTLRVCKSSGKIATDLTPDDQTEIKTFTNVHSEMPSLSNWEGVVRIWAEEHGMGSVPPTEKCDEYTPDNEPKVSISSPPADSTLSSTTMINVDVTSGYDIELVQFYIDNVSIGEKSAAPYSLSYDFSKLASGSHTLKVSATNKLSLTGQSSINFKVASDSTAPGNATNVKITSTAGSGSATIQWTNPIDSDLESVAIYQSKISGSVGSQIAKVSSTVSSVGNYTITGLSLGTYYFTLRPIDINGNENKSSTQYNINIL
jgi:1A family penicillin-binding protein